MNEFVEGIALFEPPEDEKSFQFEQNSRPEEQLFAAWQRDEKAQYYAAHTAQFDSMAMMAAMGQMLPGTAAVEISKLLKNTEFKLNQSNVPMDLVFWSPFVSNYGYAGKNPNNNPTRVPALLCPIIGLFDKDVKTTHGACFDDIMSLKRNARSFEEVLNAEIWLDHSYDISECRARVLLPIELKESVLKELTDTLKQLTSLQKQLSKKVSLKRIKLQKTVSEELQRAILAADTSKTPEELFDEMFITFEQGMTTNEAILKHSMYDPINFNETVGQLPTIKTNIPFKKMRQQAIAARNAARKLEKPSALKERIEQQAKRNFDLLAYIPLATEEELELVYQNAIAEIDQGSSVSLIGAEFQLSPVLNRLEDHYHKQGVPILKIDINNQDKSIRFNDLINTLKEYMNTCDIPSSVNSTNALPDMMILSSLLTDILDFYSKIDKRFILMFDSISEVKTVGDLKDLVSFIRNSYVNFREDKGKQFNIIYSSPQPGGTVSEIYGGSPDNVTKSLFATHRNFETSHDSVLVWK